MAVIQKEYTPEQKAELAALSVNPAYWAAKKHIRLGSGLFTFKDHEYIIRPMSSPAKRKCCMKATGLGFSECMGILPTIHGMIYGHYPQGVLYMFPTNDDVQDYSKSRFDTLSKQNPAAIGCTVGMNKAADNVKLKKIGQSFLYLRGATLIPSDDDGGGEKSSKLSGIQVDRCVFDEIALMNQNAILKALGRMGHSKVQEEVYIANPRGEDEDIDIIWKASNQMYWHRKCLSCNEWTCAESEFPQCVKLYGNADERLRNGEFAGYVACKKCGRPVPMWAGDGSAEWVATHPEIKDMEGYSISHLSTVFHDPAAILQKFNNPPQGNLGDVYRLDLGRPYSSAEDKLQRHTVLSCCAHDAMAERHPGPCAMGVDVGIVKHVVIGCRINSDKFAVLRVVQAKDFNEISDLARRYNVKSSVVDIRPYEDEARAFQRRERGYGNKVWLCQYTDTPTVDRKFNENTGVVTVYRTGILDHTHREISEGNYVFPRICSAIEEFVQQVCNCAKHKELDRNKTTVYRYSQTGNPRQGDHYRHALGYFDIAAAVGRIATVANKYKKSAVEDADNNYAHVA